MLLVSWLSDGPIRSAGSDYARVVRDVEGPHFKPNDTVSAVFQSACPRNSLKNGRAAASFLDVEWLDESTGSWIVVSSCLPA